MWRTVVWMLMDADSRLACHEAVCCSTSGEDAIDWSEPSFLCRNKAAELR